MVTETVTNVAACDRPIGWTQHVTLGPPFLEHGMTEFRTSATRSRVFETPFGAADYLVAGADFDWPSAPRIDGGVADLSRFTDAPLLECVHGPSHGSCRGTMRSSWHSRRTRDSRSAMSWHRADFPWLGIWEENRSRTAPPWNGQEVTRGMEFGASPFPETRRQMIDRGHLYNEPTYRWIPAQCSVTVAYQIQAISTDVIPATLRPVDLA